MVNKALTLIVIGGPTAVGKSAVAIALAQKLGTVILSADSRQIYKEMEIGTAKPNLEDLSLVKHCFINHVSIQDEYSAGKYEADFDSYVSDLFTHHHTLLLVGGTGLYMQACLEGLDAFPPVSPTIKNTVSQIFANEGTEGLFLRLQAMDPAYAEVVDRYNHRRMVRALEVCLSAGKPYSEFHTLASKKLPYRVQKFWLNMDRPSLHSRINHRVDAMMSAGLWEEAQMLYPYRHLRALDTVGYRELFDVIDGKLTLPEAIDKIKTNTRRYAKRQVTWFSNQFDGMEINIGHSSVEQTLQVILDHIEK